jgi:hypothetical protein
MRMPVPRGPTFRKSRSLRSSGWRRRTTKCRQPRRSHCTAAEARIVADFVMLTGAVLKLDAEAYADDLVTCGRPFASVRRSRCPATWMRSSGRVRTTSIRNASWNARSAVCADANQRPRADDTSASRKSTRRLSRNPNGTFAITTTSAARSLSTCTVSTRSASSTNPKAYCTR